MPIAYFDCYSGICGDMLLGALFDLGLDLNYFKKELKKMAIHGYEIEIRKNEIDGIYGKDVYITVKEKQKERSWKDIQKLIDKSNLDKDVKKMSAKIFLNLAIAEGKVHNIKPEKITFHEVGAVDSIIDIVGAVIGIKKLNITDVFCSPLPIGRGFVFCSHGKISIPAPATVELLKEAPVYQTNRQQELVTPTGAAIVKTYAKSFGLPPQVRNKKIGYGMGKTKSRYPNLLRVIIGEELK